MNWILKLVKKKKEIIFNKFYPDIKVKLYWNSQIENTIYDGVVSKEEYEKIKTLPPDTHITFAEIKIYYLLQMTLMKLKSSTIKEVWIVMIILT